jgi:hypothetical protein
MPNVQELRVTEGQKVQAYRPLGGRALVRLAAIATLWAVLGLSTRLLAGTLGGGSLPATRDIVVITGGLSVALTAILAIVVRRTRVLDASAARNAGIALGIGLATARAPELSAIAVLGALVEVLLAVAANLAAWKVANASDASAKSDASIR